MDQNSESFQNQPFLEAEMRRIESETAKNEAERRKFIAEAEEVEKRVREKWHLIGPFVKWALAGVIVAGLIANWFIFYFSPMLQTKQINAELENAKQKKINELQYQENEIQKKINEEQRQENERITNENRKNQAKLNAAADTLKNIYDFLANKLKLSAKNPANMAELLKSAEQRFNALNHDIVQLRLKNIYFDSTSFELRPDAKTSLNENLKTLQEFPDIKIRIEAYGDGIMWNTTMEHRQHPGFTYQTFSARDSVLADKRARKAMDYLTEQGISVSRITIIGHAVELKVLHGRCNFVVVKQ
jgi:outer membrane protein OmpA-like peptidoglycan-associated protein